MKYKIPKYVSMLQVRPASSVTISTSKKPVAKPTAKQPVKQSKPLTVKQQVDWHRKNITSLAALDVVQDILNDGDIEKATKLYQWYVKHAVIQQWHRQPAK